MNGDLSDLSRAFAMSGSPAEQVAAAANEAAAVMKRNMEIGIKTELVSMNPSLSRRQKRRITRRLKKMGAETWSKSR